DPHQLFHGGVGVAEDARAEKQPLDEIAAIEVERQRHYFPDREAGPGHIVTAPADAVGAVVDAHVGKQDLEQGNAAAVLGITVADTHAIGIAQTLVPVRPPAAAG